MHSTSLLFLSLIIPSLASITPITTTKSTLLSFGAAHTTHTYLLSTPEESISSITVDVQARTDKKILSRYETNHVRLGSGDHNITVDLFFESWVGSFDYAIVVTTLNHGFERTYTQAESHAVYGMVIYQGENIISGDEQQGLKFSHYLTPDSDAQRVKIMTNAPEGVDMTPILTARDTFSQDSNLLPSGSLILSNNQLTIRPGDFLTGAAVIDIICPGLEIDGEVFETVIEVSVSTKPRVPVILVSANGTFSDGETRIEAVLKNGDEGVVLMINGAELRGEEKNGKFIFKGNLKPGIYEHVGIRNSDGDGVVNERLTVEVLDGGDKKIGMTEGKKGKTAFIVITVIVSGFVLVLVGIALIVFRRSQRAKENIIDARVEHIARDAYGRGSVQV